MQLGRRILAGRIAAVLMAGAAGAAGAPTAGRAETIALERITGEGGRYSIGMPRGYTSKTSPRPDGGTMHQLTYMWKDAVGQFNVIALAVIDPPPGSAKQIDIQEAQRAVAARYPGSFLAAAQDVQSGPAKGLAFAMTVNSNRGQGQHVIAVRVYAYEGRLYELLAATRTEDRNDPTVAAFMNSLQIVR